MRTRDVKRPLENRMGFGRLQRDITFIIKNFCYDPVHVSSFCFGYDFSFSFHFQEHVCSKLDLRLIASCVYLGRNLVIARIRVGTWKF